MSAVTSRSGATAAIRPFRLEIEEQQLTDLFRRLGPTTLALERAGRRSVAGRAISDHSGARPLLGDRLRLAPVRSETQRAAPV